MRHNLLIIFLLLMVTALQLPAFSFARANEAERITPPYSLQNNLTRAEELFRASNFAAAIIFYYEGLLMASNEELKARLHFRIGECLEGLRRFDFATYHYKMAMQGQLPEVLMSRAIMKLEHLPELAQTEEATRLFKRSMELYKQRNIREAIDDYLASLRLKPSLMAQDESGLIDDAVKYLTYLSEARDKEPERLLKLATLLELRGDIEKSVETLQQLAIIYPDSDAARQADAKLDNFKQHKTTYLEPVRPDSALREVLPPEQREVFSDSFEFRSPGTISRQLENGAFTFRAINQRSGIPADRFEIFTVTLGDAGEQKEYYFTAEEGIHDNEITFDTAMVRYRLTFAAVNQTRGYIQDLYGAGSVPVTLFSVIRVNLRIELRGG